MQILSEHILESVLITGCNKGIGLEFVKFFVETNKKSGSCTKVFACSRRLSSELEELITDENVYHIDLDIVQPEKVEKAVSKVKGILGEKGLNLLINNAAIQSYNKQAGVQSCSPRELTEVFNVNVSGTHSMTLAFYPLLKLSASQRSDIPVCCARAAVFNISSQLASIANTNRSYAVSYKVSKTALNMLIKMTSMEFIEEGILSLAVHPGWVRTGLGGFNATLSTAQSVADMVPLVQNATKDYNGQFIGKDFVVFPN